MVSNESLPFSISKKLSPANEAKGDGGGRYIAGGGSSNMSRNEDFFIIDRGTALLVAYRRIGG